MLPVECKVTIIMAPGTTMGNSSNQMDHMPTSMALLTNHPMVR
jgi:hypothetical protein